jgi:alpha-D-ribose 1-methylphosphonate 5-triphosphate synthase subunit PhnG
MNVRPASENDAARQRWMGILAKASAEEIGAAYAALDPIPAPTPIRAPETGTVLLRGRIGGTGAPFNFGEATMTRCTVRLAGDGPLGFGYVLGRDRRHAEIAAIFDALLQQGDARARAHVDALAAAQAGRARQQGAAAATSKVDFFTMVRE